MVTDEDDSPDPGEVTPESEEQRRARLMMPAKDRRRLRPKPGLEAMVYGIMDIRHRGLLEGDPAETWALLKPEDLELLDDVAETLEWFRMQRLQAKLGSGRRRAG